MATTNPIARKRKIMASQSLNSCNRKKRALGSANWSHIPVDVLGLIASKITSVEDYIALRAVCRWWGSASKENLNSIDPMLNQKSSPGWLMQVSDRDEKGLFYSLNRDKFFKIDLPQIAGSDYCFGSPFGCLVTCKVDIIGPSLEVVDVSINLFNPLSETSIPLPNPMLTLHFSYFFMRKAILTAPPRSPDCLVIISYNDGNLAFTRPGDTLWYSIHTPDLLWEDFIYFNTNLYGCKSDGHLYVFDLSSTKQPKAATAFAPSPRDDLVYNDNHTIFLADLGGELCLLIMFSIRGWNSSTFEVYKIDLETKDWTRVMSLGNWCFVLEGLYDFFSINVNGSVVGEDEVCQHKKMSRGCIYCPNYQTLVWNVEKNQRVDLHSDKDRDIYTRLFPSIRINPSLLP